jgi:hypothetical protein
MSTFTEAEYSSLKSAYISLLSGEKAIQVSIGGKFIRYQDSQIKSIQSLLATMELDLGKVVARAYAKPKGRF